ncbi:MAG TPA: hypothetical protein VJ692_09555 [Nitrospiraceae bacterium]|nr:hypothetical protein [Nitrospiraceae bacterium]
MLMLGAILLILAIVAALYGFGVVSSPYVGTFRIVFYFVLAFFLITLVVGIVQQSHQGGYDPTTNVR